jgi:hypothetical protein
VTRFVYLDKVGESPTTKMTHTTTEPDMTDSANTSAELIEFIDAWLEDNGWHVDQRTLDFALDVRLLATGVTFEQVPDTPESVTAMAGV